MPVDRTLDMDTLRRWTGKSETVTDRIDRRQARLMQTALDREATFAEGEDLPAFWHYLYFNPEIPASELGRDGHQKLGKFLPPVALPRRMWAGGRLKVQRPLVIGEWAERTSTIKSVEMKEGKTGRLCFVTVLHEFSSNGQECFTERQNIVYREEPAPDAPQVPGRPTPDDAEFSRRIVPDPVLLFRYSALTFISHRIHYDIDYVRNVEGYPGLIVHGPLTGTLLVGLALEQNPGRRLRAFDIRAESPLFAPHPFTIEGRRDGDVTHMWARTPDDTTAMSITLEFE